MGYALYVQDNIKENDYFRTTTGEIFQVAGVKEGKVYYAFGEHCWVDSIAITNFQENIIDLIEVGDYVNGEEVIDFYLDYYGENNSKHIRYGVITKYSNRYGNTLYIKQEQIKSIATHEQFASLEYRV